MMNKIRVGITMGDPSGIGPEIIAKALPEAINLAEFAVIGDKWVFEKIKKEKLKMKNYEFIDLKNVGQKDFKFGAIRAEYGRASIEYLNKAMELIRKNKIDCMVTCPISKEAVNKGGFDFSGHTEYFIRQTREKNAVMMLLNESLRFSLVTRHIPLKEVPVRLSKDMIRRNILVTRRSLKSLFGLKRPRIAVCGLNPHASDCGIIGKEENSIIKPALDELRREIERLEGPLPADVAILKAAEKKYDCVIAMYHDQALIPLKLTGRETGVNLTLGLPFVRTSPLHGTAFDIAGKDLASPNSLIESIKLAVRCCVNQKKA